MEKWKPVRGYEGYLEVSDFGNVRSLDRIVTVHDGARVYERHFKGKTKSQYTNSQTGYKQIGANHGKHLTVHRLVAEAFIPNPDNKQQVNHKDLNRANNHVSNLEWCTNGENVLHSLNSGKNKKRKPVRSLTTGKEYESITAAALDINAHGSNVRRSCERGGKTRVNGQRFIYIEKEAM